MMLVGYLDNFVGLLKALSEQNSLIRRGLTVFLLSSSHLNFTGLKEILPSLSPWLPPVLCLSLPLTLLLLLSRFSHVQLCETQ